MNTIEEANTIWADAAELIGKKQLDCCVEKALEIQGLLKAIAEKSGNGFMRISMIAGFARLFHQYSEESNQDLVKFNWIPFVDGKDVNLYVKDSLDVFIDDLNLREDVNDFGIAYEIEEIQKALYNFKKLTATGFGSHISIDAEAIMVRVVVDLGGNSYKYEVSI